MEVKIPGFVLIILMTTACHQGLKIEILHSQELNVPSASGIATSENGYFAIGDDSPFLFFLDKDFNVSSKSPVYSLEKLEGETIPKKFKPDFEAMEMISENEIIVFGSGSLSPERDVFLMITLGDSIAVKEYNITPFYQELKNLPILDHQELNIEGVAFRDGQLYLFNRGRNVVFAFVYSEFVQYLEGSKPFPAHTATLFDLPEINGIPSGFSGATTFSDQPYILFTSSVENTANAYDDGAILGSFVGMIDISNGVSNNYNSVLIPNHPTPLKVETIAIDEIISKNEANIILATDSDGGKSLALRCRLEW